MDLRWTDDWDKFFSHSSVRHHGCSMVANARGVVGEAWTFDGQTNRINFIKSSVHHHGCSMVANASGVVGETWTFDGQTKRKIFSHSSVRHHGCSMVADAGGVGVNYLLDGIVAEPAVGGEAVNWKWIVDQGKTIELLEELTKSYTY